MGRRARIEAQGLFGGYTEGMTQDNRNRVLKALGITLWELRPEPSLDVPDPWQVLEREVAHCTRCGLHQGRRQTVFGCAPLKARWGFIGGAPGTEDDELGEPLVGRAGQLFAAMLRALGLGREEVFIANIVKCRPSGGDPRPEEAEACLPYLYEQIAQRGPAVLVALGEFAGRSLLETDQALGDMRGRVYDYRGTPLVVTYHPVHLLANPSEKSLAWADLKLARGILGL